MWLTRMTTKLIPTRRFTLAPDSQVSSWLLDRGQLVQTLPSLYLEAQYQLGTHALLFATNDCPFEEVLWIYLLTPEYHILDEKILGLTFPLGAPGIYEHKNITGPMQIEFAFQGDWRLSIREGIVDFNQPSPSTGLSKPEQIDRKPSPSLAKKWLQCIKVTATKMKSHVLVKEEPSAQKDILVLEDITDRYPRTSNQEY